MRRSMCICCGRDYNGHHASDMCSACRCPKRSYGSFGRDDYESDSPYIDLYLEGIDDADANTRNQKEIDP